jgi:hypothetical protein
MGREQGTPDGSCFQDGGEQNALKILTQESRKYSTKNIRYI